MSFHYAREKRNFDAEWKKLLAWYESEGMSVAAIEELYKYDWAVFCRQRSFENRIQPLSEELANALYQKFSQPTTVNDTSSHNRYAWLDEIENETLLPRLKQLSADDLLIVTLCFIEGRTQSEAAKILHVNQSVISRKIKRIKKFLSGMS